MKLNHFDHFPEPVFYIQAGLIRYRNTVAGRLEPEWAEGTPVPEPLALEPDEEGVFSCRLGGREFQAAVIRDEDGLLLVLRNPVQATTVGIPIFLPAYIRTLLHGIRATAHQLAPVVEESGCDSAKRDLAALNQSFYRLLRLVRQLELARQAEENDPEEIAVQALDLAKICHDVCYGVAGVAQQAEVTLREEVPGGVMPTAGDRELLEIMLLELISNAMKAAGKGGEVGVRLASNGSRALITVWDNGPGMSQVDLTAMMDGDSPEHLPKPGTGLRLGLPIARYAAAAHEGAILLESPEGKGVRVTVSLPLKKPGKVKLRTPRIKPEESSSTLLTMLADSLPWTAFEEE